MEKSMLTSSITEQDQPEIKDADKEIDTLDEDSIILSQESATVGKQLELFAYRILSLARECEILSQESELLSQKVVDLRHRKDVIDSRFKRMKDDIKKTDRCNTENAVKSFLSTHSAKITGSDAKTFTVKTLHGVQIELSYDILILGMHLSNLLTIIQTTFLDEGKMNKEELAEYSTLIVDGIKYWDIGHGTHKPDRDRNDPLQRIDMAFIEKVRSVSRVYYTRTK